MKTEQPKQKRFIVTLFQSHIWYAVFVFIVLGIILAFSVDPAAQKIEIRLWVLLLLLGIVLLSGLLCSWWIARRITRPLEEMAIILERMSAGNYGDRIPLSSALELNLIQQKFNALANSLERSLAENQQLQQSKQCMLADLSHDLKTPITTIQGYSKALELGYLDGEGTKERYLKSIGKAAAYATELIDQMAELTQLDRPDYPVAMERIDAAEMLREIVADHYEAFERKQFDLQVDITEDVLLTKCDPRLIRRAVSNLLSNAIKHNPPGTAVSVRLRETGGCLQMEVTDNGSGIPEEVGVQIFEPFVRADQARQKEGAGLGLAIARQVAELHGGRLLLKQHPGETDFILEFAAEESV
jgi:signal transduction histidine kinase